MLVVAPLLDGVFVEGAAECFGGVLVECGGELRVAGEFGGDACGEEEHDAFAEHGFGVGEVFLAGDGIGQVGEGKGTAVAEGRVFFDDEFPADEAEAGGSDFQDADAVRGELEPERGVRLEGGFPGGEAPAAEEEGFVEDLGEPEVAFFSGRCVPEVFTLANFVEGLRKEGYFVHTAQDAKEAGWEGMNMELIENDRVMKCPNDSIVDNGRDLCISGVASGKSRSDSPPA